MQFITTDQRIAVEAFSVGNIYQVIFTDNSYFLGACVGVGDNFVMFQRPEPELLFALTMQSAVDVTAINDDIVISRTYSGAPPLSFLSNGQPLLALDIYGSAGGVGEKTNNLFDKSSFTFSDSTTILYVPLYVGDGSFTLSTDFPEYSARDIFLIAGAASSGASSSGNGVSATTPRTRTSVDGYITIATRRNPDRPNPADYNYMLNSGSSPLPYEPYGYKIPITCAETTINHYLSAPLYQSQHDIIAGIPTVDGINTLSIDTTIQPSNIIITAQL